MSDRTSPSSPPPEDRRGEERHATFVPATIDCAKGKGRSALIRDISASGARFLTRARLEVGEPVLMTLSFSLSENSSGEPIRVSGRVVRVERLDPQRAGLWGYLAAVQFDEPIRGHDDEIAEISALLASRGISLIEPGPSAHQHVLEGPGHAGAVVA